MRLDGLDLNLLVALEALLETQSVTKTAARLNLSQPAVSAALGRLREYFEDDLVVQIGRTMQPTTLGLELSPTITELLNLARCRICRMEAFDPAESHRQFRLIASDYVSHVLISKVIAKAARLAPLATFHIEPTSLAAVRSFERGDADLYIAVAQYIYDEHPSELLFTDELAVVCWADGKFGTGIDRAQFLDAHFAAAVFGAERRPAVSERHFNEQGIALKISVEVPTFSLLPAAVAGTDYVAVMHRRLAEMFQKLYPLAIHRLPVEGPDFQEMMQWHRLRGSDSSLQWLLALVRQEAGALVHSVA